MRGQVASRTGEGILKVAPTLFLVSSLLDYFGDHRQSEHQSSARTAGAYLRREAADAQLRRAQPAELVRERVEWGRTSKEKEKNELPLRLPLLMEPAAADWDEGKMTTGRRDVDERLQRLVDLVQAQKLT